MRWDFTPCSTARVLWGKVLSIATCGTRTHRGDNLWLDDKRADHQATYDLKKGIKYFAPDCISLVWPDFNFFAWQYQFWV